MPACATSSWRAASLSMTSTSPLFAHAFARLRHMEGEARIEVLVAVGRAGRQAGVSAAETNQKFPADPIL